uniref:Cilia and flagella associated protein 46 n=1 Tax=Amphiprion percula TaxID=161767 RepID=A0A3P8S680_AMPPE
MDLDIRQYLAKLGCLEISAACLKIYFEGNPPANQFLCRAYLCQGQLKSPPATGSVEDFEEAVMCFVKAAEISKHDPRYHFMVFNASVLYFQTVHPLLQPGRCLHLIPSLKKVVQTLEEVADQDHNWRAELMMHLVRCLVDSGKVEEAESFAKATEEFIKLHTPHLYQRLFTLLVNSVLHAEYDRSVVLSSYRRDTQSVVVVLQARLKEIGKLDQWLQTAVREGDPQAVQAVCVTQWNFCLPLLQRNIRKRIKTPLLRVAEALEDMQSMLLEMRCQVHSELAAIEEEEGHLEASLTHLQRAMLLDNGTQQERLSSAFRLLQLRRMLYETPPRTEDKAAMLMQQLQDTTDSRPILVAAGLLLAPDDFQMVLDADDTSKSKHFSSSFSLYTKVMLWATLAKTARKHEVWDVCRAACRFCLLYDDGGWKMSKTDSKMRNNPKTDHKITEIFCSGSQTCVHVLRLLAEIHFISAEVCSY